MVCTVVSTRSADTGCGLWSVVEGVNESGDKLEFLRIFFVL